MSGAYDLLVFVKGSSLQKVAGFVNERLATIEGVLSTATHFVLKTYKAFLDGAGKLDVPTIPGLADVYKVRADMFEGMYEFGSALIENQRTFTRTVLETASAAQK